MDNAINPWDTRPKNISIKNKTITSQAGLVRKLKANRTSCFGTNLEQLDDALKLQNKLTNKENIDLFSISRTLCSYSTSPCKSTDHRPNVEGTLPYTGTLSTKPFITPNPLLNSDSQLEFGLEKSSLNLFAGGPINVCQASPSLTQNIPKYKLPKRGSFLQNSSFGTTICLSSEHHLSVTETPQVENLENASEPSSSIHLSTSECTIQSVSVQSKANMSSSVNLQTVNNSTSRKCQTIRRGSSLPTHNFVKLNLKKKVFSRKGSMRQKSLKRQVYRAKLQKKFGSVAFSKNRNTCFKCGATGHWANKCPLTIAQSSTPIDDDLNPHHATKLKNASLRKLDLSEMDICYLQPHHDDLFVGDGATCASNILEHNLSVDYLSDQIHLHLEQFGFDHFRPGQKFTILRTLLGISTLSVMPTAAGKSLCYQLPALICQKMYGTVALVISPLISLMQDQVIQLYTGVNGAFINSSQSMESKLDILTNAKNGQYSFLMISPEAIVESDWLLQPGRLPSISFVCIDEAHCLADWSHHFRPSYLRVCKILSKQLRVTCFLGLSATCTPDTIKNICKNLGISNPIKLENKIDEFNLHQPGYVQPQLGPLPENLIISVSMDQDRDEAFLALLSRAPFNELTGGILVYCATREQTERLASFIRTAFQQIVDKVGRRHLKWTTAHYHAGQTSSERARIQKKFMNGQIRVLCATSAFGMGLNKPDLQVVIHYTMTKSFENYVQEIGRVGRKQQISYCHAFLPPNLVTDSREANDLRRHIFSNHIDIVMLKRLLTLLFANVKCICRPPGSNNVHYQCPGHAHAIDLQVVGESLDIRPESLVTLLAYMELDPNGPLLSILQSGYSVASVDCYGGPQELVYASQRCLALAGAITLLQNQSDCSILSMRQVDINLLELYNRWGWKPISVKQELKSLEWDVSETTKTTYRTGININFSQWKLWVWINGSQLPIGDERLDQCVNYLKNRLKVIESSALNSLEQLVQTLGTIAEASVENVYPENDANSSDLDELSKKKDIVEKRQQRSAVVHNLIQSHFTNVQPNLSDEFQSIFDNRCAQLHWPPTVSDNQILIIEAKVRDFIRVHEANLEGRITGRTLANIFHGISTPQFPVNIWSKCRLYWRSHMDVDWPQIKIVATREIVKKFSRI